MQSEIDSFIFKFKNLAHSGRDANLSFESKAGKVLIKLDVDLGRLPAPPQVLCQPPPHLPRTRNGPSYQRRREKRAEARFKAAKEAAKDLSVEEAEVLHLAEEAFKHVNSDIKESVEESPKDTNLSDEVCPDNEYLAIDTAEVAVDEAEVVVDEAEAAVDEAEVARDRSVTKVIICPVTDPNEKKSTVEKEIMEKFEAIGVKVLSMKSRSTIHGEFKARIVEISPVNLNKIWGHRLGLKNCSIISYDK